MSDDGAALLKAAEKGDLEALEALLARGVSPNAAPRGADSPLVRAVTFGKLEASRRLLAAGADVNHVGQYGRTALSYAVTKSLALTELVLAAKPALQVRDDSENSVLDQFLFHAPFVQGLDLQVLDRLLEAGFDRSARGTRYAAAGRSPLALACSVGFLPAIKRLLAAGENPNEGATPGQTLLRSTRSLRDRNARLAVLRVLLDAGLDPNASNPGLGGGSVLMAVCRDGDVELARRLLDLGADPNARVDGTALSAAEDAGHAVLVDLLLERGAVPARPAVPADVTEVLDGARALAALAPEDAARRLEYARVLLRTGFVAAAASELAAAVRLGAAAPQELADALAFENPAGVRWTYADFQPPCEGLATAVEDARFPGARVTDGIRTLPLVIVQGAACARCDDAGTTVCSQCQGSGTRSGFLNPDHEYDCEPRETCSSCGALKFLVNTGRMGKGPCAHPTRVQEAEGPGYTLSRCPSCGLAALTCGGLWRDMTACGVCGRFACTCRR